MTSFAVSTRHDSGKRKFVGGEWGVTTDASQATQFKTEQEARDFVTAHSDFDNQHEDGTWLNARSWRAVVHHTH
jgi:hypothetical protein